MSASTVWKGMILSLALLVAGGVAFAEPTDPQPNHDKKQQPEKRDGKDAKGDKAGAKRDGKQADQDREKRREKRQAERRERMLKQLFKDVELTPDQKTQVQAIYEEVEHKQRAWRDEHKDELKQIRHEMRQARQARDKEAGKAAEEKLRTLMKDAPAQTQVPQKLRELLSEEQVAQVQKNVDQLRERLEKRRAQRPSGDKDKAGKNKNKPGDDAKDKKRDDKKDKPQE